MAARRIGDADAARPEGERELARGDVVVFREGPEGAHQLINRSSEPARVLIFSSESSLTVVHYPDSDKVGYWRAATARARSSRASPSSTTGRARRRSPSHGDRAAGSEQPRRRVSLPVRSRATDAKAWASGRECHLSEPTRLSRVATEFDANLQLLSTAEGGHERGRITGLALIAVLTLALGYLHFSGGSKSVSVPSGAHSGPVDAQELQLHD